MAAHQNLASKIFCLCCKCCEDPSTIDDSKIPSQTQELQPLKHGLQKVELDRQSLKHDNAASHTTSGKSLLHPEESTSCLGSSEFEDVNSHVSKRGFHKRNLSRYSQDRWPYQPCLIGRP
ncbi:testis-expressed protein 48 [Hippopotamus amphibius kiboko]|uniref:testis-expressed protein 48 n=1 Tax=Hippopotamus amphibius kiboko TaxID=575201 RepID=UPI002599D71B|nr:testis-expressed protein 48 [Hippopotamus amphibius kiboko]